MEDSVKKKRKVVDFLLLLGLCFAILMLLNSCGTTSLMKCDNYIGPEKDECILKTKRKQDGLVKRYEHIRIR